MISTTYTQHQPGLRSPTEIPIAAAIVFEIDVEGVNGAVRYSENTLAAKEFDAVSPCEIDGTIHERNR